MSHFTVRFGLLVAATSLAGCTHLPQQKSSEDLLPRGPAQAAVHDATAHPFSQTKEFESHEDEVRRHSFIFLDENGEFCYHASQFESPHQHQLILRTQLTTTTKLRDPAKNFFSITSNEKFKLRSIFQADSRGKKRTEFVGTVFDGLIVFDDDKGVAKDKAARFVIEEQLFHRPMVAIESFSPNSVQIVFGSRGEPQKVYYMAHLIKGAENFEQVMRVEFAQPVIIPNGFLVGVKDVMDQTRLREGGQYEAMGDSLDLTGNGFVVVDEVYYQKKSAEGRASANGY